jgi:CRISPR/Cas system Type II protein with McrA/HNH and RuvC-like nuclease domain
MGKPYNRLQFQYELKYKNSIKQIMKKCSLILSMFLLSLIMMGQGTVITKYMNQYAGNEKFTKVSVSQKMFSMFTNLEAGSAAEKEFLQAVSKLIGLKVIMTDSIPNSMVIYKQAVTDVNKAAYEELVTVNDARGNLLFSTKESNGIISELIMVAGSKKQFIMISLYGDIDLKTISKMAQQMHVPGFDQLKHIDDAKHK